MRIVLADIKGRDGFVAKDTIAGGYGSRFRGTSWTTRFVERMLRIYNNLPSIQLGYLAAIFAQAGHEVVISRGELVAGDLALVLTSMVDFRNEIGWAEAARQRLGMPVGFFGTFATYMPDVLVEHGHFVIQGEAEQAAMRLAQGEQLRGIVVSSPLQNLDELPFPRWDLFPRERFGHAVERPFWFTRRAFPILSSRDENLRSRGQVQRPQDVVKGHPPVRRRDGMPHAVIGGESLLELANGRAANSLSREKRPHGRAPRARRLSRPIARNRSEHQRPPPLPSYPGKSAVSTSRCRRSAYASARLSQRSNNPDIGNRK